MKGGGGERKVVVCALQFTCTVDVTTNVATAERLVRAAHRKGAQIILIQDTYSVRRRGMTSSVMPSLTMVIQPLRDGTDLGLYRKSHIPDGPGYQDKFYFNPADTGFKVFNTKYGKIGVAICWDQWFPEATRGMVLQGAEVLLYPTAIGSEPQDLGPHSRKLEALTIETEHGNSDITFYNNSFSAGLTGDIVASAGDKEEAVLLAEFDLDKVKSKRHSWSEFQDRRPDLYKALLTLDGRA
ncbi:hypothetical protein MLD38_040219 [Melastoma candidum]|uniref:Uncharacterized protein n=1 Tax=Melastoma candidum TaxID=119954 RepID=A0ACB9L5H4_9MYRT|nr:hypothetical protein MLD38_040219 [Melastoma candidum]